MRAASPDVTGPRAPCAQPRQCCATRSRSLGCTASRQSVCGSPRLRTTRRRCRGPARSRHPRPGRSPHSLCLLARVQAVDRALCCEHPAGARRPSAGGARTRGAGGRCPLPPPASFRGLCRCCHCCCCCCCCALRAAATSTPSLCRGQRRRKRMGAVESTSARRCNQGRGEAAQRSQTLSRFCMRAPWPPLARWHIVWMHLRLAARSTAP